MAGPSELSPQKTYRLMAGAAIAVIVLLALAIFSLSQVRTAFKTSSLGEPDIRVSAPQPLPALSGQLKTNQLEGKWTLLSFWSYTCAPCLEELPLLSQLAQQWQGPELNVVTVNVDKPDSEAADSARKFVQEEGIAVPIVYDSDGSLKSAFSVSAIPHHFLINPKLKIMWQSAGAFAWNDPKTRDQLLRVLEPVPEPE